MQSEQVSVEKISGALGDAAQTVLEKMFFTMAEGEAEPMFAPDAELMHTAMTFKGQTVQSHHLHPAAEQNFRNDTADVSRGSCNQNIQGRISSTQTRPLSLAGLHTNVSPQFT